MKDLNRSKVAVFAGTPVDTKMGADCLKEHGIDTIMYPVSREPREQHLFQVKTLKEKHEVLKAMLKDAMDKGCESAFIYCNSLSGAVEFPVLEKELSFRIVTPMEVYADTARQYEKIAVIAYNPQALSGIELAMMRANPQLTMLTASVMPVVYDIEAGLPPLEIIRKNHIDELTDYFTGCGCEAMILGCTHFPYFKEELSMCTALKLIDPAEEMIKRL